MKTVVFSNTIDFTIIHNEETIGDPINGAKSHDADAIFNKVNNISGISFFYETGLDGYGNGSGQFIKVTLSAGQIDAVSNMIDKIKHKQIEPGKK